MLKGRVEHREKVDAQRIGGYVNVLGKRQSHGHTKMRADGHTRAVKQSGLVDKLG